MLTEKHSCDINKSVNKTVEEEQVRQVMTAQRTAGGGIAVRIAWLYGLRRASRTQCQDPSGEGSGTVPVGETEEDASLPRFSIWKYA